MSEPPVVVEHLNHHYGAGALRRQVLFDIGVEIRAGEIIILTGPSGSGKTTLLTLIGALRSAQDGSLRVLGHELRSADERTLTAVRKRIGYIFQAHNLLGALTARQNVEVPLQVDFYLSKEAREKRAAEALEAVSLGDRIDAYPGELSGGQRQRVAIARALAVRPQIVLADEPTASLDKETGRGVVELLERLAHMTKVTVVLVTHDNRILDIADRILVLEDGRLSSLMSAVTSETGHMLRLLAQDIRKGELVRRVSRLDQVGFVRLLDEVTDETRRLLEMVDLVQGDAFESVCEQVVGAFTSKVGEILAAERATLFFRDPDANMLWSIGKCERGWPCEIQYPAERGIAGHVMQTGRGANVVGAGRASLFDPAVDGEAGGRAQNVLSVPVADSQGRVFAVVELARGERPFDADDERRLKEFNISLGLILESWWRMSCACRSASIGRMPSRAFQKMKG